jgi:hypothetical protein
MIHEIGRRSFMTFYRIYEKNTKTNRETFLAEIKAENVLVARSVFLEQGSWEYRRNFELVIRKPEGAEA